MCHEDSTGFLLELLVVIQFTQSEREEVEENVEEPGNSVALGTQVQVQVQGGTPFKGHLPF